MNRLNSILKNQNEKNIVLKTLNSINYETPFLNLNGMMKHLAFSNLNTQTNTV